MMPVHVDRAWDPGEFIRVAADHPACRVNLACSALSLHLLLAHSRLLLLLGTSPLLQPIAILCIFISHLRMN
jgi:hypothetical protein